MHRHLLYQFTSVLMHTLNCCTCDQFTCYTNSHGVLTHAMYQCTHPAPMHTSYANEQVVAMCILYYYTQCTRAHGTLVHTVQTCSLYQSSHCTRVHWLTKCTNVHIAFVYTQCIDVHVVLMNTLYWCTQINTVSRLIQCINAQNVLMHVLYQCTNQHSIQMHMLCQLTCSIDTMYWYTH